ncbi:hypothetical protein JTE90_029588 [Oedothorax gibbosus]|uniref:Uncharacterized protein n=1 Tax=Oedothorax gibbosus TaxID=931172 RepID=A0AAV6TPI1_9ARAC|nr:hypothetical protein JTE90_029588 [Oedothorax gibbosus]
MGAKLSDHFPAYLEYTSNDADNITSEYEKARCFIRDLFLSIAVHVWVSKGLQDGHQANRPPHKAAMTPGFFGLLQKSQLAEIWESYVVAEA